VNYFIAKILRSLLKTISSLRNSFVIFSIKLKYPNILISKNTKVEKGCVIRCSDNSKINITDSTISSGTIIHANHGGIITIKNSFIGRDCVIVSRERIDIDSNCQIAEMVVIRDQNHNFGQKGKTIEEQGFTTKPVVINKNVWLAAKVTVLAGSIIGNNTVVGANAVVKGNFDSNSVYVGIPAKKIKSF
jgi:acetyltransferase-like isoleucine patch superfamily enzyme